MDKKITPANQRITVLLIDPEISFASIVQFQLERYQSRKFNLVWKERTEDALSEIRKNEKIDIILANIELPESNGLEFYLQLTQLGIEIPFIFLSSSSNLRNAISAMKIGVEDYILKDDLAESLLPKTIINAYERSVRKRQIETIERRMLIAKKKSEAIQELVVTICHEFNNPLAAIKISADLLQRQNITEEDKKNLRHLEKDLERIEGVVRRLRDLNFDNT